jgi:hypothetical protein
MRGVVARPLAALAALPVCAVLLALQGPLAGFNCCLDRRVLDSKHMF